MRTEAYLLKIKDLFSSQKFAVLSTNNAGRPYCNLVAFASTEEGKRILFATTRATRKYENISSESRVALLIDNRTNNTTDLSDAMAVTAVGRTEEVSSDDRESAMKVYLSKHPELKDFVSSPTCALFRVDVETYYIVNRFQNVQELHVSP